MGWREDFLSVIAPDIVADYRRSGVLPSITAAQAILEGSNNDGSGLSELASKHKNLFGIKGTGTAGTVTYMSPEEENGKTVIKQSNFRAYNNYRESIYDHSNVIAKNFPEVVGEKDYKKAAEKLVSGDLKYATDSHYADKIVNIIEDNNLQTLDTQGTYQPKESLVDKLNPLPEIKAGFDNFIKDTLPKIGLVIAGLLVGVFGIIFLFGEGGDLAQ